MSYSVTIEAKTANELRFAIRELAFAFDVDQIKLDSEEPTQIEPVVNSEPAKALAVETEPEPQPESAPEIDMETVRAKLSELVQAGKQEQVKELLAQFGVAKLSDLSEDKYPELMQAASEIE